QRGWLGLMGAVGGGLVVKSRVARRECPFARPIPTMAKPWHCHDLVDSPSKPARRAAAAFCLADPGYCLRFRNGISRGVTRPSSHIFGSRSPIILTVGILGAIHAVGKD